MIDPTPCPRRAAAGQPGKPCQRTFGEQRCTFCQRELPLSHPTFVSEIVDEQRAHWRDEAMRLLAGDPIAQAALRAAAEGRLPPPPSPLTCPLCSFEAAGDSGCPACGASFYRVVRLRDPEGQVVAAARPEVVAAARRIKRALLAEADRAAGIDSRVPPRPSYHDLHVTTPTLPRTSLFDLPYDIEVSCSRAAGWEVWRSKQCIAGEYHGPDKWLVLDVDGHVICDTRAPRVIDDPGDAGSWDLSGIPDEPTCPTCGKAMNRLRITSSSGTRDGGDVCLDCSGLGKLFERRDG